jgi:multidrug resistance efflux pump
MEVFQSQFRYSTARTNYEKAKKDLERYEALYEQGVISTSQVESSRLALQAVERCSFHFEPAAFKKAFTKKYY